MKGSFKVATRGSPLALAQAHTVTRALSAKFPDVVFELLAVRTEGDERPGAFRDEGADAKRAFTKRLEDALQEGRADAAVHSLKDLPVVLADGLALGGVPPREPPWDALVSRGGSRFADLPEGAVVGTSSLRRQAQLRAARPGVAVAALDGNVDTRLRKLDEGRYDAIVLAAAGLRRLGLGARITEMFDSRLMVPAVGQGALAVEVRAGDPGALAFARSVEDERSRLEVDAELAFARALGVGCNVPAGAVAALAGDTLSLTATVCSVDGTTVLRAQAEGKAAAGQSIAAAAVADLRRQGAGPLLEGVGAG